MTRLPDAKTIWEAAKSLGLDPWPIHFEQVPASALYEFAAYLIPGRMSHWSYGKAFYALKTRYDYGLSKLYEMVINANPAYAFLLETNTPLEDVFVMAHVMGHVDFFAHNQCFGHTPNDMLEQVSRHAERIRQYQFDHGAEAVEKFLDAALAIQEHVNLPSPIRGHIRRTRSIPLQVVDDYSDLIKPDKVAEPREVKPRQPNWDLVQYIIDQSTELEDWQREALSMVRSEMLYFWPQIRTKIMNEGWATYWHVRLLRVLDLDDSEYVDFARLHSSVLQPMRFQINPYLVGFRIYEHIAETQGEDALWVVRQVDDDVSFIRNYLDARLVEDLDCYTWGIRQDDLVVESNDWTTVRQRLVQELTHGGIPVIHVDDGDFNRRGELYLIHQHEGQDLDVPYADHTLRHIHRLWGRPVHLETRLDDRRVVLSFDGQANTKVVL